MGRLVVGKVLLYITVSTGNKSVTWKTYVSVGGLIDHISEKCVTRIAVYDGRRNFLKSWTVKKALAIRFAIQNRNPHFVWAIHKGA